MSRDREQSNWARLAELLGPDHAALLIERHGGTEIKISAERPGPRNPLVDVCGLRKAIRVASEFGAGNLVLPTGGVALKHKRVKELSGAGFPGNKIARITGYHVRTVYRILRDSDRRAPKAGA